MQRIIEYGTDHTDPIQKPDFIDYSCRTWSDHLTAASAINLTDAEIAGAVKTFVTLFSDPTALVGLIRGMINYPYTGKMLYLFNNSKIATTIRTKWLLAAREQDFTNEQWEWIQKSRNSTKSLFEPLGRAAAKLWLTKRGADDKDFDRPNNDTYYCWIAWAWLKIVSLPKSTSVL